MAWRISGGSVRCLGGAGGAKRLAIPRSAKAAACR